MNTPHKVGPEKARLIQLKSLFGLEYYSPTPSQVTSGKLAFQINRLICSRLTKTTQAPNRVVERHAITGKICKSCNPSTL
jgi:hypothetical protein